MRHHNDDQHDALNDYLDSLAGAPPAASRAGDLDAGMHDGVDHFFDLAEKAGMTPRTEHQSGRTTMNATLPASTALPLPTRKTRRGLALPAWTQHLHLLSTGLLIVAVIALSFAAFGPNGLGGRNDGTGDGPGHFSAVPVATVPDDAVTSSIPYPTADECTVEPMTREEIIQAATDEATSPSPAVPDFDQVTSATEAEATEILDAYRQFQACRQKGMDHAFALMTPFAIYQYLGFFPPLGPDQAPPTDEEIARQVDFTLFPYGDGTPPPPAATPAASMATPEGFVQQDFRQTIFPDDVRMFGPDAAEAIAYWVDLPSGELQYFEPTRLRLVYQDGQWLIDYTEQGLGRG